MAPFQPIPDSTQVHVDRLVGAQVGEFEAGARVAEGRFGTLYRARHRASGREVSLEVLRTERTGDDEEARAANAIKCTGIADVSDFGLLPDGRRYRVMELLEGESLEQVVQRRGRLPAPEVAKVLGQIAEVLEAAHAWAIPHGGLGPSSVWLVRGQVKLIDFGLEKRRASLDGDLHELGALGFLLLTGEGLVDGAPPPRGRDSPEPLDRLLRDLLEKRLQDATAVRKELALAVPTLLPLSSPAPRQTRVLLLAVLAMALGGAALFFWPSAPRVETSMPVAVEDEAPLLDDGAEVEPEAEPSVLESAQPPAAQTGLRPTGPSVPRHAAGVPSAKALMEEISRLESRFRGQLRPGDDVDQALYVLNKQRLQLSGAPSEQDRKEVARQLAGWRRSYLRR